MRKVTLEEWSGPVSPKFQWRLKLAITDRDVDYEHSKTGHKKGKLSEGDVDALWKSLDEKKAFSLGGKLEKRKVGVGINTLVLERDEEKMTLEYTTNGLTADQKAVIDAIKRVLSSVS